MDKIIFSISKTDTDMYVLEDKIDKKIYKFNDFSEIIEVFSDTDYPKLSARSRVIIPTSQENKVEIFKRMSTNQKKDLPKYFWSQSTHTFDPFEKISIREVLKHIKNNMKGW